jgi:guanylate kinase
VSPPDFDKLVADDAFLEWAEFAGHRYGTPREPVLSRLAAGIPALLEIDLQGARSVREAVPDAQLVFLRPPTWEELVRRLTRRGTEDDEVIQRRLVVARQELAHEPEFDHTLTNSDARAVCAELVALMVPST